MKKIIYTFLIVLILVSCGSSSIKNLQKGNYDKAIDKAIKGIMKDSSKEDEIQVLSQSYKLANQKDMQKIEQFKLSGQPDIWDEVFIAYDALNKRQEKIARLAQVINLDYIGYQYINYSPEITNAKNKATEYYYIHAHTLLDKGDKFDARKAHEELLKVKSYYPNYKDVEDLIEKAYNKGCTFVLLKIENNSRSMIPNAFREELSIASLSDLNEKWTIYDAKPLKDFFYDYYIIVNIKMIDISPESFNQHHFSESKQLADGWKYKLDRNGNVMKDSLGNDIKIPKYTTISCNINEVQQYKAIVIAGSIDFINNNSRQKIKSDPVRTEWFFKNTYATASGDLNALSPQSISKLQTIQMPFPSNSEMIMQAANLLKTICKDIIRRNHSILK